MRGGSAFRAPRRRQACRRRARHRTSPRPHGDEVLGSSARMPAVADDRAHPRGCRFRDRCRDSEIASRPSAQGRERAFTHGARHRSLRPPQRHHFQPDAPARQRRARRDVERTYPSRSVSASEGRVGGHIDLRRYVDPASSREANGKACAHCLEPPALRDPRWPSVRPRAQTSDRCSIAEVGWRRTGGARTCSGAQGARPVGKLRALKSRVAR